MNYCVKWMVVEDSGLMPSDQDERNLVMKMIEETNNLVINTE